MKVAFFLSYMATGETTGAAQIKETTAVPPGKIPNDMKQEKRDASQ